MSNSFAPNPDFVSTSTSKATPFATSDLEHGLSTSAPFHTQAIGEESPLFMPPASERQSQYSDSLIQTKPQPFASSMFKQERGKQQDSLTGDAPAVAESENLPPLSLTDFNIKDINAINTVRFDKIKDLTINPNFFSHLSIADAAGDSTAKTIFEDGALRLSYQWFNSSKLDEVRLEAVKGGSVVANLGTWSSSSLSNKIVNLASFPSIDDGVYKIRATAELNDGSVYTSSFTKMRILPWTVKYGTLAPDNLTYAGAKKTGSVFLGRGGTDTLDLNFLQSDVKSINGVSLGSFNPFLSNKQAIFQGSSFDHLTLKGGREVYFQGIENLKFSDGSRVELQVRPNDTYFGDQWNLRVSDVESAWRFSRGSSGVLLASLDTGILTSATGVGSIHDISHGRLITDPTDDDNYDNYGHGHSAISVMASNAYNGSGVAGINWYSQVHVSDVYSGMNLQTAITETINYAKANNMKVVFQGGIQGEGWLTSGGTQAQLQSLISSNSNIALFAIAAGNGGPGGNLSDPDYLTSVSGVAKLQTSYSNVMSVGALKKTGTTTVNGLSNASTVDIASYSNRGSNLTLMAATDSPAMTKNGTMTTFGGTSCANPNMAGIASLVWSVNPYFSGGQVRQLLIDTAMDLGTRGKDNTFGNGLVNADAAVRRALALKNDYALASLYSSSRWQPSPFIIKDLVIKDIKFTIDPKFTHILTPTVEDISLPEVESRVGTGIASPSILGEDIASDRPAIFDELVAPNHQFLDEMVKDNRWSEAIADEFTLV